MDPIDAAVWVCGFVDEYVGFADAGEDGEDYWEGDVEEFVAWEDIRS